MKVGEGPMRTATIIAMVAAISAASYVFAFTGIVAPIARVALLLMPAIFMVSLVVGFASRMRSWFE